VWARRPPIPGILVRTVALGKPLPGALKPISDLGARLTLAILHMLISVCMCKIVEQRG